MNAYWKTSVATARAVLVKEESTNMEESSNRFIAGFNSIGMALTAPVAFLVSVLFGSLFKRLKKE
jgi:hypothetical protein